MAITARLCSYPGCDQLRDKPRQAYCRGHRNAAVRKSQQRKRDMAAGGITGVKIMYFCRTCKDVKRSIKTKRDKIWIIICQSCGSERLISE